MFGVLSIMATLAMFGLFIFSSNKIHEMVLDKEMEQNELVTSYITNILNSEMEDCLEILHTSEEFLSTYKKDRQEEVTDSLRKIKEGTVFEYYGIMDFVLEGEDTGSQLGWVMLAVPLHHQGTVFSDLYEKADLALYKVKRQG